LFVNVLVLAQMRGHIDCGLLLALYSGFLAGSVRATIRSPGER
jgi:hypothetical protein